jgi:hypothetical protein
MNWGDAKTLANGFIHRTDIDWSLHLPVAMDDINGVLVVQDNESATTLSLVPSSLAGWNSADLPADFAGTRAVMAGTKELDPIDIKGLLAQSGSGSWYAVSGMKLWAQQSSLDVVYTRRIPLLVADTDTNVLTNKYSQILLYGLLKHACHRIQDFEARDAHAAALDAALGDANAAYAMTVSAGQMSRTPYAIVSN